MHREGRIRAPLRCSISLIRRTAADQQRELSRIARAICMALPFMEEDTTTPTRGADSTVVAELRIRSTPRVGSAYSIASERVAMEGCLGRATCCWTAAETFLERLRSAAHTREAPSSKSRQAVAKKSYTAFVRKPTAPTVKAHLVPSSSTPRETSMARPWSAEAPRAPRGAARSLSSTAHAEKPF